VSTVTVPVVDGSKAPKDRLEVFEMPTGATMTALAVAVAVAPRTAGLAMHATMAAAENHPNLVLVPVFAFVAMFFSLGRGSRYGPGDDELSFRYYQNIIFSRAR
jgi:hypothetical protein